MVKGGKLVLVSGLGIDPQGVDAGVAADLGDGDHQPSREHKAATATDRPWSERGWRLAVAIGVPGLLQPPRRPRHGLWRGLVPDPERHVT